MKIFTIFSKKLLNITLCMILLITTLTINVSGAEPCPDIIGDNKNNHNYVYYWASPSDSFLVSNHNGGLLRFQGNAVEGNYLAETYENYNLISTKLITQELPIFGGFYSDEDHYYILSGQENKNENPKTECFRITKYDLNWNRLGQASLYDCNTTIPFDAGCPSFAKHGKYLFIHTSHEMYASDDGLNHQANLTIQLDTETMDITDKVTDVHNVSCGYMSHSFNQFVLIDNGKLVTLDHGDAHLRALTLITYPTDISSGSFFSWDCQVTEAVPIPGEYGDNYTGIDLGGFEFSDSHYIMAYNSISLKQRARTDNARNIFVTSVDKKDNSTNHIQFTFNIDDNTNPTNPFLVKLNTNTFMLMWSVNDNVFCVKIDGKGNKIGDIVCFENAFLSDCQPILYKGEVVWYTYHNEEIVFYRISAADMTIRTNKINSGHNIILSDAPNGPGDVCYVTCSKCNFDDSFETGTGISVYWKKDDYEGSYSWPLKEFNYKVGDRLDFIVMDHTQILHNEKDFVFSNRAAVEFDCQPNGQGYIAFKKSGVYTLNISYKYNPDISESFTFYVADANNNSQPPQTDAPPETNIPPQTDIPPQPPIGEIKPKDGIGDINGNDKIDMTDYILLKRAYFGTYIFTDIQNKAGDINENDKIDMTDYILLKRIYFGTYTVK